MSRWWGYGRTSRAGEGDARGPGTTTASCAGQGVVQPLGISVGVVRLEGGLAPVRVEGRLELADHRRRGDGGETNVPFEPVEERRFGEVRAADVRRVEAAVPAEEPCLRMEAGGAELVIDLDLGAEVAHQPVQGTPFGGTDIGRRKNADGDTALARRRQRLLQDAEPMPFHERAEEIDAVGRSEFGAQLETEAGVLRGVRDECRLGQRRRGAYGVDTRLLLLRDGQQLPRPIGDEVHPLCRALDRIERFQNVIGRNHPLGRREALEYLPHGGADMAGEYVGCRLRTDRGIDGAPARGVELLHPLGKPMRNERFVKPSNWCVVRNIVGHAPEPSSCGCVLHVQLYQGALTAGAKEPETRRGRKPAESRFAAPRQGCPGGVTRPRGTPRKPLPSRTSRLLCGTGAMGWRGLGRRGWWRIGGGGRWWWGRWLRRRRRPRTRGPCP